MPEQGDNIVGVEADVFKRHVARIAAKEIAKETAASELKEARQAAKAAGIALGSMDEARKRAKMSRDDLIQQEAEVSTYAKWLGAVELGTQIDWITHNAPSPTDLEKAKGLGEMAGLTGEDPSGGHYGPGSAQYNAWMEGWHLGSAIFQEESDAEGIEPLGPEDDEQEEAPADDPPMPYYEPPVSEPALVHPDAEPVPFDPDEPEAELDGATENDVFNEGWSASHEGMAQSECPYETGDPKRGLWLEGFDKERASQK